MDNHLGVLRQALDNFGFEIIAMADGHAMQAGLVVFDGEDGPISIFAEERAAGDLQHVRPFPNDDAGFHTIGITERTALFRRLGEIDNHIDALFFDAERRDLQEAGRFDHAHATEQRHIAAPMFEENFRAGSNFYGVGGEHVDFDFEIAGVAQFEQGRAGGNYHRAFLEDAQHPTVDGREDRKMPRVRAGGAF